MDVRRSIPMVAVMSAVAFAATAAAEATAGSRIFEVRASDPAVTIEEAYREGKSLALVGRGEGTALFRIDNGSSPVPCSNSFTFVTSTGERVERAADLCTLNWDLTVEVASAAAAPPPPPPPAQPPPDDTVAVPAGDKRTVTVTVDEWGVIISEVYVDGERHEITGGEGNSVEIAVEAAGDGIVCQREIDVVLTDRRRLSETADICDNGWTVVLEGGAPAPSEQAGEGLPPLPPEDGEPRVVRPAIPNPPESGPPAPPTAAEPAAPAPAGRAWSFDNQGDRARLTYGIPGTDSASFVASCVPGSGTIAVTLPETSVPGLADGTPVTLSFAAGSFSKTYPGAGAPLGELAAIARPQAEIPAADPLWPALIRETELAVAAGPVPPRSLSLKGSAGPGRSLVAACARPAPPTAPVAGVPGSPRRGGAGMVVEYTCRDGGVVAVTYNGNRGTAKLSEPGAPPIVLEWRTVPGGGFYVAGPSQLVVEGNRIHWRPFGGRGRTCHAA